MPASKKIFYFGAFLLMTTLVGATTGPMRGVVLTKVLTLDGNEWQVAMDAPNVGQARHWWSQAVPESKPATVPWGIQSVFPGYQGVAWYWRDFAAPANPHKEGRYLLRFWSVNYLSTVWINGFQVGTHEGADDPFVFDITECIKSQATNRLAVRVVTPTTVPAEGLVDREVPGGRFLPGGGIEDAVELLVVPVVRIENLYVRPEIDTGIAHIQVTLRNAGKETLKGHLQLSLSSAAGGEMLDVTIVQQSLPVGDTLVRAELKVSSPRCWEPREPYLYQVAARVWPDGSESVDEQTVRCGFRNFRFENGYFRLNGRRLFLRTCLAGDDGIPMPACPPWDYTLIRRGLFSLKAMGFDSLRYAAIPARRRVLELCDEIGLMVYQESRASMLLADSPKIEERFRRSVGGIIKRDRNHPSVVIWGLLNEVSVKPTFRCALDSLPLIRSLDSSRMVMLNSGGFDGLQDTKPGFRMWSSPHVAGGLIWSSGQLTLLPGTDPEYTVVRWTAPAAGQVTMSAAFESAIKVSPGATVDVHVLHNHTALCDSWINLQGKGEKSSYSTSVSVQAGDTIDCAVGYGLWAPDFDSTSWDNTNLKLTITDGRGKTYDAGADFADTVSPNGVWSYGNEKVEPGQPPAHSRFVHYKSCQTIASTGSYSNPGSTVWQTGLNDRHFYPRIPHTAEEIRALRDLKWEGCKIFLSEYGIGSGLDLLRERRSYEQYSKGPRPGTGTLERFMADWEQWRMAECFGHPEVYFEQCLAKMAAQRALGFNALRACPDLAGLCVTCGIDPGAGDGLLTTFREFKPGTVDAVFDGLAPLRWCLFAEPVNVCRGKSVKLEAVLANEDVLKPGEYPVRLEVFSPRASRVLERKLNIKVPARNSGPEPPFALPVFSADVPADWPAGKYRLVATFDSGAAAAGGAAEFYVAEPLAPAKVGTTVVLWGEDAELSKWLTHRGISFRQFAATPLKAREVLLVGNTAPSPSGATAFKELAARIARGSTAVFLEPRVFACAGEPPNLSCIAKQGALADMRACLFPKDEWAKHHPIFEGLPSGGLMDYAFYQELLPDTAWTMPSGAPAEVVAAAINTSLGYTSGVLVLVDKLGAGRIILSALRIRENLGRNPTADRLLVNMLRYAQRDTDQPVADLPSDFEEGFRPKRE